MTLARLTFKEIVLILMEGDTIFFFQGLFVVTYYIPLFSTVAWASHSECGLTVGS